MHFEQEETETTEKEPLLRFLCFLLFNEWDSFDCGRRRNRALDCGALSPLWAAAWSVAANWIQERQRLMPRLLSFDELRAMRDMLLADRDQRPIRVTICAGTACGASGSNATARAVRAHLLRNGLAERVALQVTGCHGFCEMGPFLCVEPQQAFYAQVKSEQVPRIIEAALAGGFAEELLYRDPQTQRPCYHRDEIPFFKHQQRTILGLSQQIDPTRIYDYLMHDGYLALDKALSSGSPAWILQEVKDAGLRGRGGGGFPTGLKWEMLARQPGHRGKIVVCNADEGDPGAYMDRSVLEGNPHSILEGMLIGAYATGATEGIV